MMKDDLVVKVLNDAGDVIADVFQPEKHEIQDDIKKAIATKREVVIWT